ncbi:MAG: TIGR03862 family flavoprotein [Gammaproteobacteria bacterium]
MPEPRGRPAIAIVGSGPAGLAAAEMLASEADVHVFDAMPSPGRKFLLAGKSGLNLTHAEDPESFLCRFGPARAVLEPALRSFPPAAIRQWAAGLDIDTFVGSSGRVFPVAMKASPLLRAWLSRLRAGGVKLHVRHRWQGWNAGGGLVFATPDGVRAFSADATVLALGGASWPRLGSDGAWTTLLADRGVRINPLRPANCGFDVAWSTHLRERFAGSPVKPVCLSFGAQAVRGEFVVSAKGIEGSAVYTLSAALRDALEAQACATLRVDLLPDRSLEQLGAALSRPRGKASLASHLRKAAGIEGVKAALLRETADAGTLADPLRLAAHLKALPLVLTGTRPLVEAISTAGGVALDEIDAQFMLRRLPGVFVAGEMLDWEAPTGGYLLSACLATGRAAGSGVPGFVRGR